jgi:hypothetical protein
MPTSLIPTSKRVKHELKYAPPHLIHKSVAEITIQPYVYGVKTRSLIIQSFAIIGAFSIISNPADAKPGKGNGNGKGHDKHEVEHAKNNEDNKSNKDHDKFDKDHDRFDDSERSIIAALFRPENSSKLPPGLAMNAQRGKPLPPGWQKKLPRLPHRRRMVPIIPKTRLRPLP